MYNIIYTIGARNDLRDISEYIGEYSFDRAMVVTQKIQKSINDNLSVFPNIGELYNKEKDIRKKNYKDYSIFYKVIDENVYIINIVNLQKPLKARGINF